MPLVVLAVLLTFSSIHFLDFKIKPAFGAALYLPRQPFFLRVFLDYIIGLTAFVARWTLFELVA